MQTLTKQAPLGVGAIVNGVAYYCDTIDAFFTTKAEDILERLISVTRDEDEHLDEQVVAWKEEIRCLKARLKELEATGYIVFEYNIVRMAKRIDVVLLLRNVVYSLEFKVGQKYTIDSIEQALDYAFRLKSFHKMSKDMYICPVLIATEEKRTLFNPEMDESKVIGLQKTNSQKLAEIIKKIDGKYGSDEPFDFNEWFWSDYHPSPSIVEAAVDAFNNVPVSAIARSEAGQDGIDACVKSVNEVIEYAKREKKKCVCFVTGVPGAGKTLVGLDIAAQHSKPEDDLYSVYISGNGPLVDVLQEALSRAWKEGGKVKSFAEGKRKASALIQDAYEFRNHYLNHPIAPNEKILIFDEAQRVWNAEHVLSYYSKSKKGSPKEIPNKSEAELAISFMDRHEDWAVIICLVGLGQDIHNGEIGVYGWFHPVLDKYRDWELFYSPDIFGISPIDDAEKASITHFFGSNEKKGLHLNVSVRSFRAEKVSGFVNDLVEAKPETAKKTYESFKDQYPIFVTRDLELAKEWARRTRVGTDRIGMIASSASKEAELNGIKTPSHFYHEWPKWFLENDVSDSASSNSLVYAASEFNIQGLEIDWAILCWGADYRYENGEFTSYVLRSRGWSKVLQSNFRESTPEEKARWIQNAYRVNLTRARQGMVIYVPKGDRAEFANNSCSYYDSTYDYLTKQIGLPVLGEENVPTSFNSKRMSGPTVEGIEAKLNLLKELLKRGSITKEEYEKRREAALDCILD